MKVVLDEIYTFGMKVVLDELVFYPQAEVTDHQYQVDTDGRTTEFSQSPICITRVCRNVEMHGPDIALERLPAEQDSATSKGCDSEACSECRVLLKICSFLERTYTPRAHDAPDERIPGATGWTRVPTQQRQPVGTAQVVVVILEVHLG